MAPRSKVPRLMRTCPGCGEKYPGSQPRCPACGANYVAARRAREEHREEGSGGAFAPEKAALNYGVLGGILLIVIAAVWFVLGWMAGYIFFYPPILAIIGLFGVVKGMAMGNVAGGGGRRSVARGRRTARRARPRR